MPKFFAAPTLYTRAAISRAPATRISHARILGPLGIGQAEADDPTEKLSGMRKLLDCVGLLRFVGVPCET